jgi:hypothetical protein
MRSRSSRAELCIEAKKSDILTKTLLFAFPVLDYFSLNKETVAQDCSLNFHPNLLEKWMIYFARFHFKYSIYKLGPPMIRGLNVSPDLASALLCVYRWNIFNIWNLRLLCVTSGRQCFFSFTLIHSSLSFFISFIHSPLPLIHSFFYPFIFPTITARVIHLPPPSIYYWQKI